MRRILAFLAIALVGGCATQDSQAVTPRKLNEAAARGRRVFAQELAQENLKWYVYGDRLFTGFDRETGLPEQLVSSGPVDPLDVAFAAAHNNAILGYLRTNGPPPGSFRQYEPMLFDQPGYFARRTRETPPQRLQVGGPPLESPDGKYRMLLQWSDASQSLITRSTVQVMVFSAREENETSAPAAAAGEPAEVVFGPAGSNLAFVRWTTRGAAIYAALDLRSARWLTGQTVSSG